MQSLPLKAIYLLRHGETKWTKTGQHTGMTDIPLTANGYAQAKALANHIQSIQFDHVFTSPLIRALDTCKACGFDEKTATITDDLLEWNYGDYEGVTTKEIHKTHPDWNVFSHGAPHGESVEEVTKRADHLLQKCRHLGGTIALFSSGHISRALGVRWLNLPLLMGKHFMLSTASLSILGYEHDYPVIELWNDTSHYQ